MKKIKYLLFISFLFFLNFFLAANDALQLYLHIQNIENAAPPELLGENIILTYQEARTVYYVGARFDHEDYRVLHRFKKNGHGIFVLVIPRPFDITKIRYRIVVDGLWMNDPFNPQYEADSYGIKHSIIYIPPSRQEFYINPEIMEQGNVKFIYQGEPDADIFIAGDFNKWDPFLNRLLEESPGQYIIILKIYPGYHYYYFVVNGKHFTDPYNIEIRYDADGFPVSTFFMPAW